MTATAKNLRVVGEPPKWDEKLRLRLEKYLADNTHLDTNLLSQSSHIGAGVSKTTLDAYLDRTYFMPKSSGGYGTNPAKSQIETKIRDYLDRVQGKLDGDKIPFKNTIAWEQFKYACDTAIKEKAIIVVYASPGFGKSTCLREYGYKKQERIPIQVFCSANVSPKFFIQEIAIQLNINDNYSIPKLEKTCAEKLSKYPRPIFVDQANYLNEKSLGTICYLWERANVPIVLVGTEDLYDLFRTSSLTEDVRVQLSSRIKMIYKLSELDDAEAKTIIESALKDSVTNEQVARIISLTDGNFRHLSFIFPRIRELKRVNKKKLESGELTMEEIIDEAGSRLFIG